ncbi:hypothetical protein CWE12_03070 [Aliidiomarina sedimenti]|uniref:Macroglobulin domain-containing protein n=1 Tax=Aliidiomarina sedimenti TaxID=1933879 RepID=A0ABY0C2H0_9GAMM|nr:hypothetical protein [Aliidiomarina sedimenti]RUO31987.1 hypothetical protein CWE12_03070 [Aliidiomarina sedimenti]
MKKYWLIGAAFAALLIIGLTTWSARLDIAVDADEPLATEPELAQVLSAQAQPTATPGSINTASTDDEPAYDDGYDDIAETPAAEAMQAMASQQQAILQYPSYSQPYEYIGAAHRNWNRSYPVEIPVLDGDETLSLQLQRYHHIYPQAIEGELVASMAIDVVRLELVDADSGTLLYSVSSDEPSFAIALEADWPRNLRLRAEVSFGGGREQLSTDLTFHYPAARVTAVGQASVEGDDVVAEVTAEVEQAGIYRLRAVLSEDESQPLAVLTARERLATGQQRFLIRAHHSVLPEHAAELYLTDLVLERMSSHPGDEQGFGQSNRTSWPLGTVNPADIDTSPYQPDAQEQRQIEFLRNWQG